MTLRLGFLALCLIATTMAKPATDCTALRAVSDGSNQFSSAFFQAVAQKQPGNLITSPLSAAIVLSMAGYGARGNTEKQFKDVLHLPKDNAVGQSGYQSLIDSFNNVKGVELRLANKIFLANGFSVKPTFKSMTESYFRSTSDSIDFSHAQEAADIINSWAASQTNNRIKDILSASDIDPSTALVLLNAVYFKGLWKNKFDPKNTVDKEFHVDANTVKKVPTMFQNGHFKYGEIESLNAKFIELPYKGDELSMVIILPNEYNGLAQVEEKLKGMSIAEVLSNGFSREVNVHLPKFNIESTVDLEEILKKLGLTDMFTSQADFSGIADANLSVSKVLQKAFIEVNEEGSEAAAVTEMGIVNYSLVIPEQFVVDRPFFFSIVKVSKEENNLPPVVTPIFDGHILKPAV